MCTCTGGYPCQAYTPAGKRMGCNDERGQIWFEGLDKITAMQPRLLLLENVADLARTADFKPLWQHALDVLTSAGYHTSWRVVTSAEHGLPQSRERVYLIAARTDQPMPLPQNALQSAACWIFCYQGAVASIGVGYSL